MRKESIYWLAVRYFVYQGCSFIYSPYYWVAQKMSHTPIAPISWVPVCFIWPVDQACQVVPSNTNRSFPISVASRSVMQVTTNNSKPLLGSSVTLSCRIFEPNGYPIEWLQTNGGGGTKSVAKTDWLADCERWHVRDSNYYRWDNRTCKRPQKGVESQDFNLTIIKTRLIDTGDWFCDEKNATHTRSVRLDVLGKY